MARDCESATPRACHPRLLHAADQQRAFDRRSQQQLAISDSELWALEYIDPMHLHYISEALDSDSSGLVTTQEVNRFTISRPRGWRYTLLPQFGS